MPVNATIPEFEHIRLPEKISFGFQGGPEFLTSVVQTQGGFEQRNVDRSQPLHRFRARHEFFEQQEFDDLLAFFMARRGKAVGFLFFNPGDYASDLVGLKNNMKADIGSVIDTLVNAGNMVPQDLKRVIDGAVGIGDGVEADFQILKTYLASPRTGTLDHTGNPTLAFSNAGLTVTRSTGSWITDGFLAGDTICFAGTANNDRSYVIATGGVTALVLTLTTAPTDESAIADVSAFSNSTGGADLVRPILKPVRRADGVLAVRPFVGGVEYTEGGGATGFSIDTTTGIITFNVSPPAGSTVTADYLFDLPVRFNADFFNGTFEDFQYGSWENLEMVELRLA